VAAEGVAPGRVFPQVSARDKRTLEVRQVFPLPRPGSPGRYHLDLYLYLPRSFGISPSSFSRADFYRDGQAYLRLTSSGLSLADLYDLKNPANPAAILRGQLAALVGEQAPDGETLSTLAQMYGAEVADAVDREGSALRTLIEGEDKEARSAPASLPERPSPELVEKRVRRFCKDALSALGTLRRVRAKAYAYRAVAPQTVFDSLAFAEEYACAVVDEQLSTLGRHLEEAAWLYDGTARATRVRLVIAECARAVNERRVDQGFALPWGKSPEYYSYRIGILKKEVQRSLYLDTRQSARDPFFSNTAAMVAAGLAATWATLAQLPLWTGKWSSREGVYFLLLAVGAYVLKDRIKEWTRERLSRRFLRWDHNRKIVGDALSRVGLGSFAGHAKERMTFVSDEEIPENVRRLRVKNRTVRGVTPELEQVIHYRRSIEIAQDENDAVPEGFGVMELFRLSTNELIKRLDDPLDQVAFFDNETGRFKEQELPKVYHLNLVLVVSEGEGTEQLLKRYRVVVNRKGILRVDPVLERREEAEAKRRRLLRLVPP
jgi:hypothetical protein